MRPDIFISYSHADRAFAAALARSLENEWVVWWDDDLVYGQGFEPAILEKISAIPVVLIIISTDSISSDWVRREKEAALKTAHVIPILKSRIQLPDDLQTLHCCDLTDWDCETETDTLKRLHRDIRLVLEPHVHVQTADALAGTVPGPNSNATSEVNWQMRIIWSLLGTALITVVSIHLAPVELHDEKLLRWSEQICSEGRCGQVRNWVAKFHQNPTLEAWLAIKSDAENIRDKWKGWDDFACRQREIGQRHARKEINLNLLFPKSGCPDPLLALIAHRYSRDMIASYAGEPIEACVNRDKAKMSQIFGQPSPPPEPFSASLQDILEFDVLDELERRQCDQGFTPGNSKLQIGARDGEIVSVYLTSDFEGSPPPEYSKMIAEGHVSAARQMLESIPHKNASEQILLARMYDRGVGGPVRMTEGVQLLKEAILIHNSNAARFNLGIAYVFGRGIRHDVYVGTKLIEHAIGSGFDPEIASQALRQGCCGMAMERFPEVQKRINLLAEKGNAAAKTLKAVYAVHGLSIPPCSTDCLTLARTIEDELRRAGQIQFALAVKQSIEVKERRLFEAPHHGALAVSRVTGRTERGIPAAIERTVLNRSEAFGKPSIWTRIVARRK
jgi:TIR domain